MPSFTFDLKTLAQERGIKAICTYLWYINYVYGTSSVIKIERMKSNTNVETYTISKSVRLYRVSRLQYGLLFLSIQTLDYECISFTPFANCDIIAHTSDLSLDKMVDIYFLMYILIYFLMFLKLHLFLNVNIFLSDCNYPL